MESLPSNDIKAIPCLTRTEDTEIKATFITQLSDPTSCNLYLEGLRHDFLGMLKLPTIGKYSNTGYSFAQTISLSTFSLQGSNKTPACTPIVDGVPTSDFKVVLPPQVHDILYNISNPIPENNRSLNTSTSNGQQNITSFFSKQDKGPKMSKEEKDMENDLGEAKNQKYGPTETIELAWVISLNTFSNSDSFKKPSNGRPGDDILLNYVLHPWLFPALDFSKKKRLFTVTPLTLVRLLDEEGQGWRDDIEAFVEGEKSKAKHYNGINFESLRMEYSSIHMKGPSLCFSPNNLKFYIRPTSAILSDFWTVVLDENNKCHKVFFHWLVNSSDCHDLVSSVCSSAKDLPSLLLELESIFGKDTPAIKRCKKVFCFEPK